MNRAERQNSEEQIAGFHKATNAIVDRLDSRADNENWHNETIRAICTLTQAVLALAQTQLRR